MTHYKIIRNSDKEVLWEGELKSLRAANIKFNKIGKYECKRLTYKVMTPLLFRMTHSINCSEA